MTAHARRMAAARRRRRIAVLGGARLHCASATSARRARGPPLRRDAVRWRLSSMPREARSTSAAGARSVPWRDRRHRRRAGPCRARRRAEPGDGAATSPGDGAASRRRPSRFLPLERSAASSWRGSPASTARAPKSLAETGTCPTWRESSGRARCGSDPRGRLPTGVYPARMGDSALAAIARLPSVHGCGDALSGALMNAGPSSIRADGDERAPCSTRSLGHPRRRHPAAVRAGPMVSTLSASPCERPRYGAPHYPLADHYATTLDVWRRAQEAGSTRATGASTRSAHAPLRRRDPSSASPSSPRWRWAGDDAPIAHGLLAVTGGFLGRDLRLGPRTLEALGLAALDRSALQRRLHDGE